MEMTGFVPSGATLLTGAASRWSLAPVGVRKCCCPVRACAAGPNASNEDEDRRPLEESRAELEKMLAMDVVSSTTPSSKTGTCECIWCNGTKERKCSWCDGQGVRQELMYKSWEEISIDIERMQRDDEPTPMEAPKKINVQCSACNGTCKLRCAYCRGSGIGSYGHAY